MTDAEQWSPRQAGPVALTAIVPDGAYYVLHIDGAGAGQYHDTARMHQGDAFALFGSDLYQGLPIRCPKCDDQYGKF